MFKSHSTTLPLVGAEASCASVIEIILKSLTRETKCVLFVWGQYIRIKVIYYVHTVLGVPLDIITAVVEVDSLVGEVPEIILEINLIPAQPQYLEHCALEHVSLCYVVCMCVWVKSNLIMEGGRREGGEGGKEGGREGGREGRREGGRGVT